MFPLGTGHQQQRRWAELLRRRPELVEQRELVGRKQQPLDLAFDFDLGRRKPSLRIVVDLGIGQLIAKSVRLGQLYLALDPFQLGQLFPLQQRRG